MTPMMRGFVEWEASADNPLVNASDSIKHSVWPALRAAFRAGSEWRRKYGDGNIFDEGDNEDDVPAS